MTKKKALVVGSGGREHALAWKLAKNADVSTVYCAPGNGGTRYEEKVTNVCIDATDTKNFQALHNFIQKENIELTVIGPELPLANGIVDFLNAKGYNKVFGPTQEASTLETDKFYSYILMKMLNIPQANSIMCYSIDRAISAIEKLAAPEGIVIKARGLAAGKGVAVCDSKEQALEEIIKYPAKHKTNNVLIAERLFGKEFSVFGISDGKKVYPINIPVQDYKRVYNGNKGQNTGSMGSYAPVPFVSQKVTEEIFERILNPLVQGMKSDNLEYKGFLYAGMILTDNGPKVIEFNTRLGDPECQPMMMLMDDLFTPLSLALDNKLNEVDIKCKPGASCCVVLASKEYPNGKDTNHVIFGLDAISNVQGLKVFHSGTMTNKGAILTAGGRILGITAYSPDGVASAQSLVYKSIPFIKTMNQFHYRTDIADC